LKGQTERWLFSIIWCIKPFIIVCKYVLIIQSKIFTKSIKSGFWQLNFYKMLSENNSLNTFTIILVMCNMNDIVTLRNLFIWQNDFLIRSHLYNCLYICFHYGINHYLTKKYCFMFDFVFQLPYSLIYDIRKNSMPHHIIIINHNTSKITWFCKISH